MSFYSESRQPPKMPGLKLVKTDQIIIDGDKKYRVIKLVRMKSHREKDA